MNKHFIFYNPFVIKPHESMICVSVLEDLSEKLHLFSVSDLCNRKSEVEVPPIPDHKLIVSVPCTLHSHKPPLAGMFLGSPLYDK